MSEYNMSNMCFTPDLVVQNVFQQAKNKTVALLNSQYMLHVHAISINYRKQGLRGD